MDPIKTAADVYRSLVEIGSEEVENNPNLLHELQLHYQRLGPRYAKYITEDTVQDVLLHKNLLVSAKDPNHQPAFGVQYMRHEVSREQDGLLLPVHEVIFCLVNQPRILGQLLQLLYEINLNIRVAHVFSTIDGYSLEIFEVDGWHLENNEDLQNEMENAIARNENVVVRVLGSRHLNGMGMAEFGQEVNTLRGLQHKNVVRLVGACIWSPDICMVAEDITGHSLLHLVDGRLTLTRVVGHALDVCEGMEYLHGNDIIHGNLCLKNLLADYRNVQNPEQGKQGDVFKFGSFLMQLVQCREPHPHHWSPAALIRARSVVRSLNCLIESCSSGNPANGPSFSKIRIVLQKLANEVQDLNSGATERS